MRDRLRSDAAVLRRAYDRGMPENQSSENASRILAAPPGLQLLGTDTAGVCSDGYCVLPAAAPETADEVDEEADAEASDSTDG